MKIKVFGPGCANCKRADKVVRAVIAELGLEAEIEKVEDYPSMMAAGIMSTPAVSVDGQVKIAGRVPKPADVRGWFATL